ncbi:MAG: hypothetical protein MUD08_10825 [Cytophagales bacterium]|jgi:hypothetical protein|nr:hypothetical protein [Cytophagales bacterium]
MSNQEKLAELFAVLHPALFMLEDEYFVIGSSALVLTGVETNAVSDLDILTSWADADRLKLLWADRRKASHSPENALLFRSNFARFAFETMDVEAMGDLEINRGGSWQRLRILDFMEVPVADHTVRIPTLAEQKRIFLLFGRQKDLSKADLIK